MSDTDIIPFPQLNPESGKIEPGFKAKGGGNGDGGAIFAFIMLALIAVAVYWIARKLIALYKHVEARLRARAEVRRLAALPEGVESLSIEYPRCADATTRERIYAEAEQDRRLGRTNVQSA